VCVREGEIPALGLTPSPSLTPAPSMLAPGEAVSLLSDLVHVLWARWGPKGSEASELELGHSACHSCLFPPRYGKRDKGDMLDFLEWDSPHMSASR
jgi:hypothetical protein